VSKASELLQQTDRLIKTVPEVARVFGKAGRADTATDPAPLEMFETTIQFKPREQWRAGMTPDKLVEELDRVVKVPGLSNVWVPPIRNRIDMLATGIKSPVGIKVAGCRPGHHRPLTTPDRGRREEGAGRVVGTGGAAHRRALHRRRCRPAAPPRATACRCRRAGRRVDGHRRRERRRGHPGPRALSRSTCATRARSATRWSACAAAVRDRTGAQLLLGRVAKISIEDGPPMLRSENARLSGWVYVDVRGRDLRSAVNDMQAAVARP
jgi:Cu(I)/Ag(I) efflux system membrane protein CusA/SilA